MSFQLFEFSSSHKRDHTLVRNLVSVITQVIEHEDRICFALSGGRSPIPLFEALSIEDIVWEKCDIRLVDERIVDIQDKDSNAKLIKDYLLKNKAHKAIFTPLLTNANKDIDLLIQEANANYKIPHFAVLGMGNDGHTASIFSSDNSSKDEFDYAMNTKNYIIATTPTNAPYKRLSMSLHALKQCKRLFLSISGMDKRVVLDEAMKGINESLPISYILNSKEVSCDVYYSK